VCKEERKGVREGGMVVGAFRNEVHNEAHEIQVVANPIEGLWKAQGMQLM
jgi:hypothetical protein